MSVKLKKIQRANPQDRNSVKWYLTQEKTGSVGMTEIAREIESRSSLSIGDVKSVLNNLVEVLPVFLRLGQTIKLEGFGSFRISVTSEGIRSEEELSVHNINSVKIIFLPGVDLKQSVENISFEID